MKKKRGTLYLVVTAIILAGAFSNVTTVDAKTKNGFTYDKKEFDVKWSKYEQIEVCSDEGGKLGTLSYLTGIAKAKKSNESLIMFKEVMTPNSKKVKLNYLNQKGYGMSEYMSLKATLPSLNDYKPHIPNIFGSNKYLANESIQMGMAEITSKKDTITFNVNYEARFGAAEKKNCSPGYVCVDYVKKNKAKRKYTFKF